MGKLKFLQTVPVLEIQGQAVGGSYYVGMRLRRRSQGGEKETTNNRMELMAAIRGLEALKRPAKVVLTTDSSM